MTNVWFNCGYPSIGLTLNIYRPGKSYRFTNRFTKGLLTKTLNLLRLHRPNRSNRSASVFAKFGCQHMPPAFLLSFASQKASTRTCFKNKTLYRMHRSKIMLRAIFKYQPSSPSSILPHTGIIFLQVSPIDSSRQTLTLHRFHHIWISGDNLDNLVWTLPTWQPFAKLIDFHPMR